MALDRRFLGFSEDLISKSQVRKLRTAAHQYLSGEFLPLLIEAFKTYGFGELSFELEELKTKDQDPISILIYYPNATEHSAYLPPRIKVEVGGRSMNEPFTMKPIVSLVGEHFPKRKFADQPINIPCVNPERTYLEKLFFRDSFDIIQMPAQSIHSYFIRILLEFFVK